MNALEPSISSRIAELAAISESPDNLTRVFMSPEQRRASDLVLGWMRAAGMSAHLDAIGNVVGRYEGDQVGLPALALGSHLDTVRDAGKYDGMLGVVTAIACVDDMNRRGDRRPFAIEVIGFSDEEGVRFGSTLLGSRAVAGTFESAVLGSKDDRGTTMADAIRQFGLDPTKIPSAARRRQDFLAYVELHIEQGPLLEKQSLAVGCVTSINGADRFNVQITGVAGHAGTVPMFGRRDALAAASECILVVERRCSRENGLVGTVGRVEAYPSAVNTIPGGASLSIDMRAPDDSRRRSAVEEVLAEITAIASRRSVEAVVTKTHEAASCHCAPWLMDQVRKAIAATGTRPFDLASGAGHDGMAMAAIADIGMIFVRCAGGISHNPAEAVSAQDIEAGARVLSGFISSFSPTRGILETK